jgi:putative N-acetyltransferase (TIGR04045 family)
MHTQTFTPEALERATGPADASRAAAVTEFRIKHAMMPGEREGAYRLRRAVFCDEQGIFEDDDRDALDERAHLLVALACAPGLPAEVVGTVRIHEEATGLWWGSRLAVAADFRRQGHLGASLIRLAVSSANTLGCHTFLAHVQKRNVPLFRRLRWQAVEEVVLHGHPHALMRAELAAYPPMADIHTGFIAPASRH